MKRNSYFWNIKYDDVANKYLLEEWWENQKQS